MVCFFTTNTVPPIKTLCHPSKKSPHYKNILLYLIQTEAGQLWVHHHIEYFATLTNPYVLYEVIEDTDDPHRISVANWLCSQPSLLATYWQHIKHQNIKELFVAANQKANGKTPFHYIWESSAGVLLFDKYWPDLKPYVSESLLFNPIERFNDEANPSFWFFCDLNALVILDIHWEDFKSFITTEKLCIPISKGLWKGKNPFHCLCTSIEGVKLLDKYWQDFKPHLSAAGLFSTLAENPQETGHAFHSLCATAYGRALLDKYWDDFIPFITTDMLFTHKIKNVTSMSRLFSAPEPEVRVLLSRILSMLCSSPSGMQMIIDHWEELKVIPGNLFLLKSVIEFAEQNNLSTSPDSNSEKRNEILERIKSTTISAKTIRPPDASETSVTHFNMGIFQTAQSNCLSEEAQNNSEPNEPVGHAATPIK